MAKTFSESNVLGLESVNAVHRKSWKLVGHIQYFSGARTCYLSDICGKCGEKGCFRSFVLARSVLDGAIRWQDGHPRFDPSQKPSIREPLPEAQSCALCDSFYLYATGFPSTPQLLPLGLVPHPWSLSCDLQCLRKSKHHLQATTSPSISRYTSHILSPRISTFRPTATNLPHGSRVALERMTCRSFWRFSTSPRYAPVIVYCCR